MEKLFLSIDHLKSVSKTRFKIYQKIGVLTPYDLLYYLPRSYKDYREPVAAADAVMDMQNVVRLTITAKKNPVYSSRGMQIFRADAVDDDGTEVGIVIFNQRFTFQALQLGKMSCTEKLSVIKMKTDSISRILSFSKIWKIRLKPSILRRPVLPALWSEPI